MSLIIEIDDTYYLRDVDYRKTMFDEGFGEFRSGF